MQNFVATKGDDFSLTLNFAEDSVAVDITGWTVTLKLRRRREQSSPDKAVTADLSDPSNGEATVDIPAAETTLLDGSYFYDVHYIDDDDGEKTVMGGVITFARPGGA